MRASDHADIGCQHSRIPPPLEPPGGGGHPPNGGREVPIHPPPGIFWPAVDRALPLACTEPGDTTSLFPGHLAVFRGEWCLGVPVYETEIPELQSDEFLVLMRKLGPPHEPVTDWLA